VKEVVVSAERIGNEVVVVVVPNHVCVLKNIQPRVLLSALLCGGKRRRRGIFCRRRPCCARDVGEEAVDDDDDDDDDDYAREKTDIELKPFQQKKTLTVAHSNRLS